MRYKPLKDGTIERYRSGESMRSLARFNGMWPGDLRNKLKKLGVHQPTTLLGIDIEVEVANRLNQLGHTVVVMPPRHPYDLEVDGARLDVKSAHHTLRNPTRNSTYYFVLQSMKRKTFKIYSEELDYFYLVFLDKPQRPVYQLSSKGSLPKTMLNIPDSLKTKRPIEFLFNLDEEREI